MAEKQAHRVTLYIPDQILVDMQHEAKRLGRSLSWVVRRAFEESRETIADLPTVDEPRGDARRST